MSLNINYLPEKVYPEVYFDSGLDYSMNGVAYGNSHISCKRVFKIIPDCTYTEYFDSYSGKSYQLVNAEMSFNTCTCDNKALSWSELRKYYPDIIDFDELYRIDRIPDFKRLMCEDLGKPMIRRDVKLSRLEEMVNHQSKDHSILSGEWKVLSDTLKNIDSDVEAHHKDILKLFNIINDLSRKITKLEEDNDKIKKQINDLIDGQVPTELSSNILEGIFEE